MQPADQRRAWTCPACGEAIHYIAGQDPRDVHAPDCPAFHPDLPVTERWNRINALLGGTEMK